MTKENAKYAVLVVEDDCDIREMICEIVEETGFRPIGACDGLEASKLVPQHYKEIAIILSDLKMPNMSGLDLRGELLQDYSDIPFALVSGYITKDLALSGVEKKICAFVEKPIDAKVLSDLIVKESSERIDDLEFAEEILATFLEESKELVSEVEHLLLQLEEDPENTDVVNGIYRLIHTIKGGANVLDDDGFVKFLHAYEDVYSSIKKGAITVTPAVISTLLNGFDAVVKKLSQTSEETSGPFEADDLVAQLSSLAKDQGTQQGDSNSGAVSPKKSAAAPASKSKPSDDQADHKLNVSIKLMDELMGQSGEITVIRNMVNKLVTAIAKESPNNRKIQQLSDLLDEMHKINSSIQKKITEIRKVPMSNVFRSLPRVVRDICTGSDKSVNLQVSGETLRVDTIISQALNASLVHMVRNSVDHGIELSSARTASGKPADGSLWLRCLEDSENITIEIEDDGAGINPEKIRAKSIEKDLITEEESSKMPDDQALMMIFAPGFSTAEQVTNVSGRGVGMDMVRTSIENLKGKIAIDSKIGEGTKFTLTLPIPRSVQIVDALIVDICGRDFALPQDRIVRLMTVSREKLGSLVLEAEGAELFCVEDEMLPLIRAKDFLQLDDCPRAGEFLERHFAIVKADNGFKFAIEVDEILDSESVVVKSIEKVVANLKVFSGATFLGEGAVGLILDVDGFYEVSGLSQSQVVAKKADVNEVAQSNLQSFISFDLDVPGKFALPLQEAFRLEKIRSEDVQFSGKQPLVRYRDSLMPLYELDRALSFAGDRGPSRLLGEMSGEDLQVLVVEQNDRYFGLLVSSLSDIHYTEEHLETHINNERTIKGNIQIMDRTHVVLDIGEVLKALSPQMKAVSLDEVKKAV